MPFRAPKTGIVATSRGVYDTKHKTFSGRGPAPKGSRKIKAAPASKVPTVTSHGSTVTTSGFPSPRAASQAKRQLRSSRARVRRVERQQASALGFHRRTRQRASETTLRAPEPISRPPKTPVTLKTVISSQPPGASRRQPRQSSSAAPGYKPPKFQGVKTAGTPKLSELQAAQSKGLLRTNRQGYVTTPAVRKVSGTLRRLGSKARQSSGPLPGLGPEESQVARKVLHTGQKEEATRKEKLAAAETGLVESGFKNLPGGDADSEGWRQERTSIYGTGPTGPRNVKAGAQRFFSEAKEQSGATAGELAANVQRPAEEYRGRYDERKPEANAIVKAVERGSLKPAQQRKLSQTRAQAQRLGLKTASGVRTAPKKVVTRFKAIKAAAGALTKRHIPYIYGAGHGAMENAPSALDCSGAVSWVLAKAGILKTPLTSGSMGSVLKPGPGAVTVFYNAGHTFMKIGNEYWGTSVGDSGAGGLGPHPAPSASYLAQYSVGHVPGLGKKQALQLGFSPSESYPGMTLSASGTTATVDPSATATRDKPGFSKSPIRLTQNQRAHRILKRLKEVGAGISETPAMEDKGAILAQLERTYGKKAV